MNQSKEAKEFALRWKDRGYEKGESNLYWIDLLTSVLGIDIKNISNFIEFEDQVHLDHTSFIDGYIPSTKVLIEQKSLGKSLNAANFTRSKPLHKLYLMPEHFIQILPWLIFTIH